jgi:O-succinylbenzoic acid--CoA ligase
MIFEINFSIDPLETVLEKLSKSTLPSWMKTHYDFLKSYNSFNEYEIETSGTTGPSKILLVTKMQMQISATTTLSFFNLKPGMTTILCLSSNYIAGKMMLVRAIIGRLKIIIIEPTLTPSLFINEPIDFIPLVPVQAKELLSSGKRDLVKTLLIGGGQVDLPTKELLKDSRLNAYESFAMTETLSHFALKRIHPNKQEYFTTLPGFKLKVTENSEMILLNNDLLNESILTKDIIELYDESHFKWLGRSDNLINSGGVKINPEQIEQILKPYLPNNNFIISGAPSNKFGQEVVLIIEGKETEININDIIGLDRYSIPKKFYFLNKFPRTESGKIQRNKLLENIIF